MRAAQVPGVILHEERASFSKENCVARYNLCHKAGVLIVLLVLPAAGCGGRQKEFRLPGGGLTMKLPAGWSQGEPRSSGGFSQTSRGNYFFENAANDDPSGNMFEYDSGVTLRQYVDSMLKESDNLTKGMKSAAEALDKITGEKQSGELKQAAKALEETGSQRANRSIGGREAVEIVTHSADVSIIELYMARDGKIICAVFRAPKNDFARCEPLFRAAMDSIKVK